MNRRMFPLWLLRDVPALLGLVLSFWPLMIIVIANGRKAMRGEKISRRVYENLMAMLPIAEAKLRHALYRQAYRAFGWDVRLVPKEQIPPITSWSDFGPRFEAYRLAAMDMRASAREFTEFLRQHYRIRAQVDANTVRAAHGSTVALRAAHHEAVGVAASSRADARVALMVSSARSARPSNHEGVLANARGPPAFPQIRQSAYHHLSAPPRLRPHRMRAAEKVPPPTSAGSTERSTGLKRVPFSRDKRRAGRGPAVTEVCLASASIL